jgi:hypothetical protein
MAQRRLEVVMGNSLDLPVVAFYIARSISPFTILIVQTDFVEIRLDRLNEFMG